MRIAVIHTAGASCGCAEAFEAGLRALGHEAILFDSEEIERKATKIANSCDLGEGKYVFRNLICSSIATGETLKQLIVNADDWGVQRTAFPGIRS